MHQKSRLDLRRVTTQQGICKQQTAQDGALWCSRLRTGSRRSCLYPPRVGPLWAWLLMGALMVPGAWSFLSEEQEELLVELHNHYRGQVSPSASAMLPLKWDPNLKVIAEGYAAKCIWNHNPVLEDIGENLYAGTGSLNLADAMEKWFLEHLDYNFQNNSCDEDKMCGHYTQMVWADTHRVGCAFHLCNTMEGLDWDRVSFLVCNYFPAGNYEGERPYVEGDWCSNCPEKLQKCENNLCVADNEEEGEEEEEEDSTIVPPPATTDPSFQPEGEKSGSDVVPTFDTQAVTAATMSEPTARDPEDNLVSTTPAVTTHPSDVPLTTHNVPLTTEVPLSAEDVTLITDGVPRITEDAATTAEVLPTTNQEEEDEVEENTEKDGKTQSKQGIAQIIFHNKEIQSSASLFSPSLLLAGLTGVLALRL